MVGGTADVVAHTELVGIMNLENGWKSVTRNTPRFRGIIWNTRIPELENVAVLRGIQLNV